MALLHPGGLLVLLLLLPLALVEWRRIRRERSAAQALGLEPQRLWRALERGLCAGLVVALAAVAASQPSLRRAQTVPLRADAEVYVFLDASASMLAGASSRAPTRLEAARRAAADFARVLPADLPVGAGALPQIPLPLTAPTADRQLFLAAIDHLAVPGTLPEHVYSDRTATNFANLATLATSNYFLRTTQERTVVVLTDAEGPSFDEAATALELKRAHVHLVFVRFGSSRDRIWLRRPHQPPVLDNYYTPNLSDLGEVRLLGRETGGGFYDESRVAAAVDAVDRLSGHGPDRAEETLSLYADSLGQYFVLAALAALAWLAGSLVPLTVPLELRERLRRRSARPPAQADVEAPQPASDALSNQA